MGIQEDGIKGEQLLFKYLKKNIKCDFFQADAIFNINNKYYLAECKHQEAFHPPPFLGHGLPKWQIEARLKFQSKTNIRAVLFVFEKPFNVTKKLYWQYLDVLESGKYFDTKGKQPRRIYSIDSFIMDKEIE